MAIINKTGIGEGNLIEAEHVTRAIDALSGGSSDSIIATGSFTGSFKGDGSQLTGISVTTATSASYSATASYLLGSIASASYADTASFANTASYVNTLNQNVSITGTLQTSGSIVNNYRIMTITDSDFTVTGGQTISSTDNIILVIDQTTTSPTPTEATIDISSFLTSTAGRCIQIVRMQTTGTGAGIVIGAGSMAGQALMLNNQSETNGNRSICPSDGNSVTLMSLGTALTGSIWGNGF